MNWDGEKICAIIVPLAIMVTMCTLILTISSCEKQQFKTLIQLEQLAPGKYKIRNNEIWSNN